MFTALIIVHVIICVFLIIVILIQAGRGGGLVDSLSGVESMFGTKTNALLTRATAILSTLFFITCVGLAFLSLQKSRSLMKDVAPQSPSQQSVLPGEAEVGVVPDEPESQTAESQLAEPQLPEVEVVENASGPKTNGEFPYTE